MNKTCKTLVAAAVTAAFLAGSTSTVLANHNPGSAPLDLALIGVNFPAWTSLGECANARPDQGCMLIFRDCNGSGYDIYTTEAIAEIANRKVGNGERMIVHTMTNGGHFDRRICSIYNG